MKKEVPPFGVLAADYDPDFHVIVRGSRENTFKQTNQLLSDDNTLLVSEANARRSTETRSQKSEQ